MKSIISRGKTGEDAHDDRRLSFPLVLVKCKSAGENRI
jgi:hypothetical protein